MRPNRIVIFHDVHVPFHDEKALRLVLKVVDYLRPDHLVVLGDLMDCYKLSIFDKKPDRLETFEHEVEVGNEVLRNTEEVSPSSTRWFFEGNHCDRLARYLARNAPELYTFVRWNKLLHLEDKWRWVKYGRDHRIGGVNYTHCVNPRTVGETAHIKTRDTYQDNAVQGHVHWLGINYRGNARGEQKVGASFGWLGDYDQVDYNHRIEARRWTHGFGVGRIVDGTTHLQAVPILDGVAVVDGKVFRT